MTIIVQTVATGLTIFIALGIIFIVQSKTASSFWNEFVPCKEIQSVGFVKPKLRGIFLLLVLAIGFGRCRVDASRAKQIGIPIQRNTEPKT